MASALLQAQDVTTGGYDNSRTNANLNETILTPGNVRGATFGRLFALPVDGQIYAQPLFRQGVTVAGQGIHNVIYAATANNTVYAFDADTPGMPLWSVNLGPAVPASRYQSDTGAYTDIAPINGILGTPVIDPATGA
ncbi:MAG: PQQ-binding-like beta-propeller repeat protein, partial [Acidobacteriota bacterium]|nr:PQQ-binding-like beta-propeller repeat protein [Acidobacteriota bacterium]